MRLNTCMEDARNATKEQKHRNKNTRKYDNKETREPGGKGNWLRSKVTSEKEHRARSEERAGAERERDNKE